MDKQAIAQAYQSAPDALGHSGYYGRMEIRRAYSQLAAECRDLAGKLRCTLSTVVVSDAEPYVTAVDMFGDISDNNRLRISNLNLKHPLWAPWENVNFRIVHDVLGHYLPRASFSWEGEIKAYPAQKVWHTPLARRALFAEIVGQTAVRSVTGEFPVQRAVLLPEELEV